MISTSGAHGPSVLAQTAVGGLLVVLLQLYAFVLLARVLLSWVPQLPEPLLPLARGIAAITDPVLAPLRRVLPPLRIGAVALDLSVIVAFFVIRLLLIPLAARL